MVESIEQWLARPGGLAERLRELRRAAGLTGTELAGRLGWGQSKVSKLETGKQMPTDTDITAWAEVCQADPEAAANLAELLVEAQGVHREWRHQVRLGQARIQRNYDELAQQARTIRNAEVVYVPGLLQTPEYARSRLAESVDLHGATAEEVDAALAQRLRRQQVLYDTSKQFEFVTTEAALRLLLCPPEAMLAQLDRLLVLTSGLPHLSFGIIPFGVPLSTAPQNGVILFDDELAVVETFVGETMHHGDEAAAYAAAMTKLAAQAWTADHARQLILRAMRDLREGPAMDGSGSAAKGG